MFVLLWYLEISRGERVDWRACEEVLSCSSPSCPLGWATHCMPHSPPPRPRSHTRTAWTRPPRAPRTDARPTPFGALNQNKTKLLN